MVAVSCTTTFSLAAPLLYVTVEALEKSFRDGLAPFAWASIVVSPRHRGAGGTDRLDLDEAGGVPVPVRN